MMAGKDCVLRYANMNTAPINDVITTTCRPRLQWMRPKAIEETKDAVGDTCAVAVRMAADDGTGTPEEPISEDRREIFSLLSEFLPQCWICSWAIKQTVHHSPEVHA